METQQAKKHLDQGEQLYNETRKNMALFNKSKSLKLEKFEREFTQTLFYFAQVWSNIGNAEKSAFYCQRTLERQLDDASSLDHRVRAPFPFSFVFCGPLIYF